MGQSADDYRHEPTYISLESNCMTVKLSDIASNHSTVKVAVGDEYVTINYYPGRITDEVFQTLVGFDHLTAESAKSTLHDLNSTLVHLVESWDVVENDGETVIPLTLKRLASVYLPFKMQVLASIMADIRPEAVAPMMS